MAKLQTNKISIDDLVQVNSSELFKFNIGSNLDFLKQIKKPKTEEIERTTLEELEHEFSMSKENMLDTIETAEYLMNFVSETTANNITQEENITFSKFKSKSFKMEFDDSITESLFSGNREFSKEFINIREEFFSLLKVIDEAMSFDDKELFEISEPDVSVSGLIGNKRSKELDAIKTGFSELLSIVKQDVTLFSDVDETIKSAIEETVNGSSTPNLDNNIKTIEAAISEIDVITNSSNYKVLFDEFYYLLKFFKSFLKHERALLYLFFMYRVDQDKSLFVNIFFNDNLSANDNSVKKLRDLVYNYGTDNAYDTQDTPKKTIEQLTTMAEE